MRVVKRTTITMQLSSGERFPFNVQEGTKKELVLADLVIYSYGDMAALSETARVKGRVLKDNGTQSRRRLEANLKIGDLPTAIHLSLIRHIRG